MVTDQIAARGVKDQRVLDAMRRIPRHEFVPPNQLEHAYEDRPLAIGQGQTISQPYIVARMTELLQLEPHHRVLEIGTGSGYQAAVLSLLAKQVYSIEIIASLGASAMAALEKNGHHNVALRIGDGYLGWPEEAPFDRIILTAAPPDVPAALIEQLKPGGILVAPIGVRDQELIVIEKAKDGAVSRRTIIPVAFVPMVRGTKR